LAQLCDLTGDMFMAEKPKNALTSAEKAWVIKALDNEVARTKRAQAKELPGSSTWEARQDDINKLNDIKAKL